MGELEHIQILYTFHFDSLQKPITITFHDHGSYHVLGNSRNLEVISN